ncbi:hypothetical protein [Parageobacillus thermoglucosidasius]|uniref:hypothetical protein n=1 Tax=Parageobacillus thermoglucosidasius TaxID=1426 RepID=UPI001FCB477F|nr:hypothetical protein [Parageobacillus thermoglucosidasius]BDG33427.1 hypothetical protein PthBH41_31390 [Parageobacillus thermoglucosidasius]
MPLYLLAAIYVAVSNKNEKYGKKKDDDFSSKDSSPHRWMNRAIRHIRMENKCSVHKKDGDGESAAQKIGGISAEAASHIMKGELSKCH